MTGGRKIVALGFGAAGIALAVATHLSADGSLLAMLGPVASLLSFVIALGAMLLPERAKAPDGARPAPRTLPHDVLHDTSADKPLAARVAAAIEMSKAESRCFGVICFSCTAPARSGTMQSEATDAATDICVAAIARSLRETDLATSAHSGEVLVFLPLLRERGDLASVSARLQRAAQTACAASRGEGDGKSQSLVIDVGTAMYPIDGYDCDDLVASARAASRAALAQRSPSPTRTGTGAVRAPHAAEQAAPVRPPLKPRVRRTAGSSPAKGATGRR